MYEHCTTFIICLIYYISICMYFISCIVKVEKFFAFFHFSLSNNTKKSSFMKDYTKLSLSIILVILFMVKFCILHFLLEQNALRSFMSLLLRNLIVLSLIYMQNSNKCGRKVELRHTQQRSSLFLCKYSKQHLVKNGCYFLYIHTHTNTNIQTH